MTSAILENAWWFSIPILGGGAYVGIVHKRVARQMADMTGYTESEKFFTISASLLPYPFMAATIWTPFTSMAALVHVGIGVYVIGLLLYVSTLRFFIMAPTEKMLSGGPYRISRNPMYVSATLMFSGICIMTTNAILLGILVIMAVLQHFMILAEERACTTKYGAAYERYMTEVSRYVPRV